VSEVLIRPMTPADVPAAERLSAESFFDFELRFPSPALPEPRLRPASRADAWIRRTEHLVRTDPGGSWMAEDDTGMLGAAISVNRELMWILATYAVRPGLQGQGLGKALLAAALENGRGCLRGMISSSSDPKAVRRYRLAGFSLHPMMYMKGVVDRSAIPVVDKVRDGSAADIELMDSIDRQTRGAGHGSDHEVMAGLWNLLVSDTSTGSGYAYVDEGHGIALLAATNRRTATRLLWEALARTSSTTPIGHLTAANEWAIDVGLAARLELHSDGYLGVRGMKPPVPYLHNGAFL